MWSSLPSNLRTVLGTALLLGLAGALAISTCMASSGGPWRSLRIAQAYMFLGTWPSGGISPIS